MDKNKEMLIRLLARSAGDPGFFTERFFPWGRGPLAGETGPDEWQSRVLDILGDCSRKGESGRVAVSSGHGVGKTALISWVILWFLSTRPHPQVLVTANTGAQLATKTWRELAKWHRLCLHADWFSWSSTRFSLKNARETWFAAAIPWNKDRPEAFAGTHERHVLVVYDEASLIADEIWDVTEGAMTSPGALWLAFGNPTRNTGRFHACFHRFRHRWQTLTVDSRTAKKADKAQIKNWIADFGEDSDFVRVRVKGVFPRVSALQFISSEDVEKARGRKVSDQAVAHAPVVLGVDVARYGDDSSVIYARKGLATLGVEKHRGLDLITFGNLVARAADRYRAEAVFVDAVGLGAGVVDYLASIGRPPIAVNGANRPSRPDRFANLRAEVWDRMREWLAAGGAIPDDPELCADLAGPEYGFDAAGRILLEKKEDMKRRGLASPDAADALSLTFGAPVQRKGGFEALEDNMRARTDYDVFSK